MTTTVNVAKKCFLPALFILLSAVNTDLFAQCSTGSAPVYSNSCTTDYYTSITAAGTGVVSTISVTGTSCSGTYLNDYATQGIIVSGGTTVNLHVTRDASTYAAYLTVYIDWNNDGTYNATELTGSMFTFTTSTLSTTYTFTVPSTGVVTGANLHMRVMLSEIATGAPCTASWGQTAEFYCRVNCTTGGIAVSPAYDTICSGGSGAVLTASGGATGSIYTWTPSAGLSATTGAVVTATPTVTTVYTVSGTGSGCSGSVYSTVTVPPSLPDTVSASGPLTFCSGDSVVLTATPGYNYQWYNRDAVIPGATSTSYKAFDSGNYKVLVSNAAGCNVSDSITVIVHPSPVPAITFDGKTFRTAKNYTSYQWYENTTSISGATHDSVLAHSDGNYTVKVTDSNGCSGTSSVYPLTRLAIGNIINTGTINIYPNPVSNIIHIESPEKVNAVITDLEGRKIIEKKDAAEMDLSGFANGIYLIELFDEIGHRLITQKLIKN